MAVPMVVSANGTTCRKQNNSILSDGHRGPREEISWYVLIKSSHIMSEGDTNPKPQHEQIN